MCRPLRMMWKVMWQLLRDWRERQRDSLQPITLTQQTLLLDRSVFSIVILDNHGNRMILLLFMELLPIARWWKTIIKAAFSDIQSTQNIECLACWCMYSNAVCMTLTLGSTRWAASWSPDPHGSSTLQARGINQTSPVSAGGWGGTLLAGWQGSHCFLWWLWQGLWTSTGKYLIW